MIKSLVIGERSFAQIIGLVEQSSALVDAFITDTFDPSTGASGATGKRHDWSLSRQLVELSPRPIILAGGLTPDNVREAIDIVAPAGVDVHTGVEGPTGRKDPQKVCRFASEARAAFELLRATGRLRR